MSNLLLIQQSRTAYTNLVNLIESLFEEEKKEITLLMLNEAIQIGSSNIEKGDNIIYVTHGISKYFFFYDKHTETYRLKSNSCYTVYDFVFSDVEIEKNRQILELTNSIYIRRYKGENSNELKALVDKFNYLTKID